MRLAFFLYYGELLFQCFDVALCISEHIGTLLEFYLLSGKLLTEGEDFIKHIIRD